MTPDLSGSKHQKCATAVLTSRSEMEQQGPGYQPQLADTLDAASRRGFIGRSAELATFEAFLERPEHVAVLWLSGLGRVGKTALMQACACRARQAGWRTARIDGRTVAQSRRPLPTRSRLLLPRRSHIRTLIGPMPVTSRSLSTPTNGWSPSIAGSASSTCLASRPRR
jgi:hypothetical protein